MVGLQQGSTLKSGKYKIIKTLGQGSFGITYLATTRISMDGQLGKMDVNVRKDQNHSECIRCGMCIKACPTRAIKYDYGFYGKKGEDDE